MKDKSPKKGEIWIVDLEPGYGRELHKKRPAVIISANSINNNTPHVIIVPASSQIPQRPSKDIVPLLKQEALLKESVLLPIFIRSIDQDRLIEKVGEISPEKLDEVEEAISLVLGLDTL